MCHVSIYSRLVVCCGNYCQLPDVWAPSYVPVVVPPTSKVCLLFRFECSCIYSHRTIFYSDLNQSIDQHVVEPAADEIPSSLPSSSNLSKLPPSDPVLG